MYTLQYMSTQIKEGNFGDDIAGFIFDEIFSRIKSPVSDIHVSLIGSLLGFPYPTCKEMHVFGTGFGYQRNRWGTNCTAHFLRGPLSSLYSGLPSPFYADAAYALLLSDNFCNLVGQAKLQRSGKAVYIPHHSTVDSVATDTLVRCNDLELVDPRKPWPEVISRLAAADTVYAEAMHGAIFADIVRTPWVPVITSRRINVFKWVDWLMGVGLPFEPVIRLSPVEARFKHPELALAATGKSASVEDWIRLFNDNEHLKFRRNLLDRLADFRYEARLKRQTSQTPMPATGQLSSDTYISRTTALIRTAVDNFEKQTASQGGRVP